jgi:hypothetical protein
MRDEIARLAKAVSPPPEDAELAATIMAMALRCELGQPATEAVTSCAIEPRWNVCPKVAPPHRTSSLLAGTTKRPVRTGA